jgi:membrane-associated protein
MRYRTFIAFNVIGALLWGVGVPLLGFWLGHYEWIGANIDLLFIMIVLVSVVPVGIELLKTGARRPPTKMSEAGGGQRQQCRRPGIEGSEHPRLTGQA